MGRNNERIVLERYSPGGRFEECRRCWVSGWKCLREGPFGRKQIMDDGRCRKLASIEKCEVRPGAIGALGEEKTDANTGDVYVERGR